MWGARAAPRGTVLIARAHAVFGQVARRVPAARAEHLDGGRPCPAAPLTRLLLVHHLDGADDIEGLGKIKHEMQGITGTAHNFSGKARVESSPAEMTAGHVGAEDQNAPCRYWAPLQHVGSSAVAAKLCATGPSPPTRFVSLKPATRFTDADTHRIKSNLMAEITSQNRNCDEIV